MTPFKLTSCQALLGLVFFNALASTTARPVQHGESSASRYSDPTWSITSFKMSHNDVFPHHKTESWNDYHSRLMNKKLEEEAIYSIHPHHHNPRNINATIRKLNEKYNKGELSAVEYSVYRHNTKQKAKAFQLINRGRPVRIGNAIHHPSNISGRSVMSAFHQGELPYVHFSHVEDVRNGVHLMSILHPPPPLNSRKADSIPKSKEVSFVEMNPPINLERLEDVNHSQQRYIDKGKAPLTYHSVDTTTFSQPLTWGSTSQRQMTIQPFFLQDEVAEDHRARHQAEHLAIANAFTSNGISHQHLLYLQNLQAAEAHRQQLLRHNAEEAIPSYHHRNVGFTFQDSNGEHHSPTMNVLAPTPRRPAELNVISDQVAPNMRTIFQLPSFQHSSYGPFGVARSSSHSPFQVDLTGEHSKKSNQIEKM